MIEVDEYRGFLDKSFDPTFETLSLPWLPWVGSSFRNTAIKTIVLGESVYVPGEVVSYEKTLARITDKDSVRRRHLNIGFADTFKKGNRARRYLANFERAVFLKTRPAPVERQRLWSQVAYFNLVPRAMKNLRQRPTIQDFETGWQQYFQVAGALEAQRCIVYGTEGKKIDALLATPGVTVLQSVRLRPEISRVRPLHLRLTHAGREMEFFFIQHPSSYFSWSKWGPVLRNRGIWLDSNAEQTSNLVPVSQAA
jgi:hypothetical protein